MRPSDMILQYYPAHARRVHFMKLRSCKRVSSFITDATDAKQRPLPHRELHEAGGAAWRL